MKVTNKTPNKLAIEMYKKYTNNKNTYLEIANEFNTSRENARKLVVGVQRYLLKKQKSEVKYV